ncbi:Ku protein [Anseongella ginsenosidimutans]|nr:Ku protein [Anseongella ginsenosidimutans]QEC52908.1 Ku protein [Anseongella ginsenosidimutans]
MRAIWSGSIGFGLVNIPVKLFSASQSSRLDLDMLDRRDHSRIKYQRINENTGKVVDWDDIVKGYELDDEYIILEEDDFEEASPEKTRLINIQDFVKESEIDSMYFEAPYYVEPDKGGQKPYSLLLKALEKSGKAGIATFVMRSSESLAVLRPKGNVLVLNKLRFEEELRSSEDLNVPEKIKIGKEEMEMAMELIDRYTAKFDIRKFKDEYSHDLMKIIKAKAKGKRPTVRKLKVPKTKSDDLLKQLKASLKSNKKAS